MTVRFITVLCLPGSTFDKKLLSLQVNQENQWGPVIDMHLDSEPPSAGPYKQSVIITYCRLRVRFSCLAFALSMSRTEKGVILVSKWLENWTFRDKMTFITDAS